MLPFLLLGAVVGVAMLSDSESQKKKARKKYKRTYENETKRVKTHYHDAKRKDAMDKAWKMKKAKKVVSDMIYKELKDARGDLSKHNATLMESKKSLAVLFTQKKDTQDRTIKREIQGTIDIILLARKEMFTAKDAQKAQCQELEARLKHAKSEVQMMQNEINRLSAPKSKQHTNQITYI